MARPLPRINHLAPGRVCTLAAVVCSLAAILICLSAGLASRQQGRGEAEETKGETAAAAALIESNLVNLNDILVHQRALVEQCRQLERDKMAQLRQLVELEQLDGDQEGVQSEGGHVSLSLPAVCLLLVGPPEPSSASAEAALGRPGDEYALRLDLVNWVYDYDELRAALAAGNKTKRQTGAARPLLASPAAPHDQWWYESNKLEGSGSEEAGHALPDFRHQMDRLLESDQFRAAVKAEANLVASYLSPVVLVPGLAGSRLQARATSERRRANIICSKQTGWQEMWLTLRWFLPLAIDCWLDNARLEFEPATGFTRAPPGVESRVPDFGSVESVRHLDLKSPKLTQYFHAIIERYEQLGYQPDRNLFAAPYDFRLAPQQLEAEGYFERLRKLIEHAKESAASGAGGSWAPPGSRGTLAERKKVTLVCHSMGCTHLLVFLRAQPAAWRQAHIRKLIALSSPWAGSLKALKALLVGEQFGLPIISELKMRKLARTFPSVAYLLPQAEVFERPSKTRSEFGGQVLVETPERSFKVDELEELLRAVGLERQWDWFTRSAQRLVRPLEPLADLQVDCIHSLNIPTVETIIFRNQTDFPDGQYELVQGDGDGTVNHQSLLVCGLWAAQLPGSVRHKIVPDTSHVGILSHKQVLEHITHDVFSEHQ